MKLATWNINSVRARKERLLAWLAQHQPDVLCLQETKVPDGDFPVLEVGALGYHAALFGQRAYNGVAILSKEPVTDIQRGLADGVDDPQARLMTATVHGCRIVCVYVPNGSEIGSEKCAYKLAWFERLGRYLEAETARGLPLIVCGDFNVAPREVDVALPELWQASILFHPTMRAALETTMKGFTDVLASKIPAGRVYSWWDYRMLSFPKGNGLRIDLIYASPNLAERCRSASVDREQRKGKQPSDHAPVLAEFQLEGHAAPGTTRATMA